MVLRHMLTLQGPTVDGNGLLETWEIAPEEYVRLRAMIDQEPTATTLTDSRAKVISQRFGNSNIKEES